MTRQFCKFYVLSCVMLCCAVSYAQDFELVVGGTADPFRWPEAESPEFAIDWAGQKYLNFERENTGFLVRPEGANAGEIATSITLWTANDAVERDPASFRLFGSNSDDLLAPLDYVHEDRISSAGFTEIAFGHLDLPDSRNEDGFSVLDDFNAQTVDFDNSIAYKNYLVVFPTVKDALSANSMQIAEVQLNYDGVDLESGIFDPFDEIAGVGLVEFAPPVVLEPLAIDEYKLIVGGTSEPVRWPGNEGPEFAINFEGQKYLNFERENTGILVQPGGPNADATPSSITFWAANDAVERDPASFRLLGSNNGDLLDPFEFTHRDEIPLDSFVEIAFGSLELPDSRNDGENAFLDDENSQTIEFGNATAYDNYLVVFPSVKDSLAANSMQIAEVQLNYDGVDVESGVFDSSDLIAGVALAQINDVIYPVDTVDTNPPINLKAFEVVVGSTEDPVRWPDGENPEQAINQIGQKYLNFERENTGVLVQPEGDNADEVATSITIWAANDSEPRDPASFRLLGTNSDELLSPLDYEHLDTIELDLFTEIAIGDLELPSSRNDAGEAELDDSNSQTFQFDNDEVFDTYLVIFPTVKDGENANSMQVAEIQLNYDGFDLESGIFDIFDEITGVALSELPVLCNPFTNGDVNEDGTVGFADFLIMSANFGLEVSSHAQGDIDCNGRVEFADFLTQSAWFGQDVGGADLSPVPEPNSSLMIGMALYGGLMLRRRS